MKTVIYILAIVFSITISSCEKEKTELEKLPSITQRGANTFGCLIDGKAFVPKNGKPSLTVSPPSKLIGLEIFNMKESGMIWIKSRNYPDAKQINMIIPIYNEISAKIYDVHSPSFYGRYPVTVDSISASYTKIGSDYYTYYKSGYIDVKKIDTINMFVSGIFEFKLQEEDSSNIINITNGRFDLKLKK